MKRLTVAPLIAATYFMVSGGPYGLEEIVAGAGYSGAIVVLLLTPLVWSLPTVLMVGELAAALPEEGGYYAWVRRALGPFWGFQEAWLSLAASVFDMAIYPTLFTLYLGKLVPSLADGHAPLLLGAAMIAVCAAWNLRGARSVGRGALAMTLVLVLPFVALAACALAHAPDGPAPPPSLGGLWGGILVAIWNYMGWDNASTIAGEVERPQRTYPLAMLATVALVALTYVAPVAAVAHTGLDPRGWSTGGWVDVARVLGGPWLGRAVALGGVVCGIGMFNALVLSYTRVPMVLARDGVLPRVFARTLPATETPWVSVLVCCVLWTLCLTLGFQRLIELDVLVYGLSLLLEFVALAVLRVREPLLSRPFRVPGGVLGASLVGVLPMALIAVALWSGRNESAGRLPTLALGAMLVAAGPLVYGIGRRLRWREWSSA
ncbi:MAG TPA: APC family permease [Polyangia bacterium]